MTMAAAGSADAQAHMHRPRHPRRAAPVARRDDRGRPEHHVMSFSRLRTARLTTRAAGDPRTDAPLPPGAAADGIRVVDRYRLVRRLGTGAFGTVWMARDERLERDVAVKILARELIVGGRFEREARAAARLSHPGIVTLYEAAVDDEGAYLVSELVLGDTLDALLAEGALSDRDIVEIGIALCDALDHAHEQGVVHRDVKPSNVLVPESRAKAAPAAKLTDFGVARVIDSDSLTRTGDVIGTLHYMAPEQAAGLEAGEAADLYSLALVLYEALSGVNPLKSSASAPRGRRPIAHLPPLRRQRRDLPGPLAQGIDLALRPRVHDRGTIAELRGALRTGLDRVDDEPGIVTGPFARRPEEDDEDERTRRLWAPTHGGARDDEPLPDADPSRLIWQARALAGAAAAAAATWLSHVLLAPGSAPSAPLALTALIAGGLVALVPRLGWIAIAVYLCAGAAIQGEPGAAVIVAAGVLIPIVLLPASPALWPVSAAAPALGLIGLAGGWPAIAGYAQRPWRRMMLGATGWLWLALATPLAGRTLYLPAPPGSAPRRAWEGSISTAVEHVLAPLAHSGVLAPAVVWAAAAILAPWMVRRRSPMADVLRAVLWSTALVSATALAVIAVHGSERVSAAPSAAAGAVAATLLTMAPLGVDRGRAAVRARSLRGEVP